MGTYPGALILDRASGRNTLVYLAISAKLTDGSPANSISAVPVMAWPK